MIDGLDHFTIATSDLEASRRFYVKTLGLRDGERPAFDFPGAWLYCGAAPVVHLVARGEAPLGIVYASDAGAFEGVRVAGSIASAHHAPIRYPIALVAGRDNPTARRFLEFLATPEMAALFRRHGFELP